VLIFIIDAFFYEVTFFLAKKQINMCQKKLNLNELLGEK